MTSRRGFLASAAAAATTPFLPSHVGALAGANAFAQATGGDPWWKGNPHGHVNPQSVGPYAHLPRSTPLDGITWYATHNYHFAVAQIGLNVHTRTDGLSALFDQPGQFLVWPSEEVSRLKGLHADNISADSIFDTLALFTDKPVPQDAIPGADGIAPDTASAEQVYIAQREAIESIGGVASLAHPMLTYSARVKEMIATRPSRGVSFFEWRNGEPGIPQNGGGGEPSTDDLWNAVLDKGKLLYATAGDDGFPNYPIDAVRPGSPNWNAGRAWIMVRAPELSLAALKKAMLAGDFYATTGVIALDYQVDGGKISITLPKQDNSFHWSDADHNPTKFDILFISQGGEVRKAVPGFTASYTAKRTDPWVRVKVLSNCNHEEAVFQPVFR